MKEFHSNILGIATLDKNLLSLALSLVTKFCHEIGKDMKFIALGEIMIPENNIYL